MSTQLFSPRGRVARTGSSVYNLTKFGVNGLLRCLRQEMVRPSRQGLLWSPATVRPPELVEMSGADRAGAASQQVAGSEALRPGGHRRTACLHRSAGPAGAVNDCFVSAGDQNLVAMPPAVAWPSGSLEPGMGQGGGGGGGTASARFGSENVPPGSQR